jgi:hypothetical protein
MTKAFRQYCRLVAVAATAAVGLAACGGSHSPHVASLGDSNSSNNSGSSTTTVPRGNPTQLLDEWASCMRDNGDPGQVDPTIDANGVIHITFPAGGNGPVDLGGPGGNSSNPCSAYLTAASTALRGGQPLQRPDPAKLEKYSQCMRAHGIPDFPDPTANGLSIRVHPGSDLDPRNPTLQNASKLCAKKTGVPGIGGTPQRGAIEATSGSAPGGGPGGSGGSSSSGIATGGGGA